MAKNMARVRRQGLSKGGEFNEVAPETLVPGDVVRLSAADMIPGDLRLLVAKNLFINQSVLTGEAMPAEKFQTPYADAGGVTLSISPRCASWDRAWSVAMPPA
jgi:Mg2+-importing ATPase